MAAQGMGMRVAARAVRGPGARGAEALAGGSAGWLRGWLAARWPAPAGAGAVAPPRGGVRLFSAGTATRGHAAGAGGAAAAGVEVGGGMTAAAPGVSLLWARGTRTALLQPVAPEPEGREGESKAGACGLLGPGAWTDELPLFVLPAEGPLGAEAEEVVYEALNRNNRKPKAANHGKRPCSRWRRRRKTYGINPDGSKK